MSRTIAYICDHCENIYLNKKGDEIQAIEPVEDMFDKMSSYPIVTSSIDKYAIHICTHCYRKFVLDAAERIVNRRLHERQYELKIRELSYGLRIATFQRWMNRKK